MHAHRVFNSCNFHYDKLYRLSSREFHNLVTPYIVELVVFVISQRVVNLLYPAEALDSPHKEKYVFLLSACKNSGAAGHLRRFNAPMTSL